MTQAERLSEYRRKNSPLGGILSNIQTLKGDPGYTPVKGKDYFTPAEIQSIISFVRSQIKDGAPGKSIKGDSIKGDKGYTPVRGIDYWTAEDIAKIKKDIEKLIPKIEKAEPFDIKAIIAELKKEKIEYSSINGAPNAKEITDLINFLKAGGFRGGGGGTSFTLTTTGTSGPATFIGGILNIPQYTGSGGGGFTQLTATGTVNGSNLAFTFTQKPTYIVTDGIELTQLDNNGNTQWSWNAGTLTATMVVPPVNSIFGFLNSSTPFAVYTEILTDSGDHQNFTALHTINNIYSIMDANTGKGIPASAYSKSGVTLTLTSPDANLATDTIQLIYT